MTRAKDISKIVTDADLSGTLDVAGEVTTADDIKFTSGSRHKFVGGGTGNNLELGTYSSNNTSRDVHLQIDSAGNVGIGTSSPDLKLDVSHGTSNEYVATFQNTADNLELKIGTTSGLLNIQGANASNNTAYQIALNAEGGNVGIGISNPDDKLHVADSSNAELKLQTDNANGGSVVKFNRSGTDNSYIGTKGYFLGNSDNNLYLRANSGLGIQFYTNGNNERMRIDSSGNVGIGETSPQGNLHIKGSDSGVTSSPSHADELIIENSTNGGMTFNCGASNSATITFQNSTYSDDGALQYRNGDRAMAFKTAGSERMRIDSSGRVMIGNTTEGVAGADELTVGDTSAGNGITIRSASNSSGALFFSDGTSGSAEYDGGFEYNHSSQFMRISTAGSEQMRITSAGNVGIGDSNPQRKISVNGIAKFRNSITLGGSNSSTDYNAYFVNEAFANNADTNSVTLGTHSTRPLIFATNTTERMRIGSNGGTVLTANASGAYAFKVINDGNASNRFGIAIQTGEDSPTTTNYLMGFQDGNGNSVGSITFNNAGQTSFNQISDYRLKENVTEDWNATTRLKELKPCRFNFKRFPNTTLDGFIAHEAQEVVPEAVIGEKDAVDDDGNPIYQGIDQSKLVPLLVKTIQELEARIVALETA
jgi:hypothetical protein